MDEKFSALARLQGNWKYVSGQPKCHKNGKNGRNSCTGNSRHVNIRFFFVKDLVDKKEIEIVYCPTETMLADFFNETTAGKIIPCA